MSGVLIEYLLGIYFVVVSLSWSGGRVSADTVKLIAGVVLVLAAWFGKSLV